MKTLIPISDGTSIPYNVIDGIRMQTISSSIYPISRPGSLLQGSISTDRYLGEIESREALRRAAIKYDDEYIVTHDSDIVHLYDDNLFLMLDFMTKNLNYAAIGLIPDNVNIVVDHIILNCVMIRKEILNSINFTANKYKCSCLFFRESILNLGMNIGYLEGVRIKAIKK
jgi:hypothetical protein